MTAKKTAKKKCKLTHAEVISLVATLSSARAQYDKMPLDKLAEFISSHIGRQATPAVAAGIRELCGWEALRKTAKAAAIASSQENVKAMQLASQCRAAIEHICSLLRMAQVLDVDLTAFFPPASGQ